MDTDDQDALSSDTAADEEAPLLNENTGHDHAAHDGGSPNYGSDTDVMSGGAKSVFRQLANRTTVAVLLSYLVFQLANISFSSLYPIFASAEPPAGRGLDPETIGLSLSFAGLITILFQAFAYQRTRDRLGSLGTYRWALLGLAVSMALMPWVGKLGESGSGRGRSVTTHLYLELGLVLVLRGVCAVGGLSSVMLLVSQDLGQLGVVLRPSAWGCWFPRLTASRTPFRSPTRPRPTRSSARSWPSPRPSLPLAAASDRLCRAAFSHCPRACSPTARCSPGGSLRASPWPAA